MDPIQLQKIHAINKSKKHQLLDNFFLYSITVLTCSLFCSSPFWFPCLLSSIKLFVCSSLSRIGSIILNSKFIFIVGNLIIILLIGETKFFASNSNIPAASDVCYNEYMNRKRDLQKLSSSGEEKKERNTDISFKENACELGVKTKVKVWNDGKFGVVKERYDLEVEEKMNLPKVALKKRADDFIARVNRQRMQEEAKLLLSDIN